MNLEDITTILIIVSIGVSFFHLLFGVGREMESTRDITVRTTAESATADSLEVADEYLRLRVLYLQRKQEERYRASHCRYCHHKIKPGQDECPGCGAPIE